MPLSLLLMVAIPGKEKRAVVGRSRKRLTFLLFLSLSGCLLLSNSQEKEQARACHPAYPEVCIPPPPPDLDCSDIPYRRFQVDHRYGDPHRFDRDRDGIGCES